MSKEVRLADYVFEFIAKLGTEAVFLVPGGGSMFLVDAVGKNTQIKVVPNHHEQASAIAAEAYSRVEEKLGVALVTTGPGATNTLTAVAGAWIESVPMLIISGQVKRDDMMGDSGVRQMGPQEVDIISMVKPITKYAATVMDPKDIRIHLEAAVHEALTGRRGPVWIDIPLDVQASTIDPETLACTALEFIEAVDSEQEQLDEFCTMLSAAKRPLILAGHGIRLSGAAQLFQELLTKLQIPVVTTWNAMDLIPCKDPLCVGKPGTVALRAPNFAVQNSDLIIAIGARLDNVVTAYNPQKFGRNAKKIVIDVDKNELKKHESYSSLLIESDAKVFVENVLHRYRDGLIKMNSDSGWVDHCRQLKERYPTVDGQPFPQEGVIGHYHFVNALSKLLPEDCLIVTGSSGLAVEVFYANFSNKSGQRIFLTSGLGAMGYGLPAAIGACISNGQKPMYAVESDGSLQMNLQELQTLKSLDLPIVLFVMNNGGYASIRNTQRNYFDGRFVGTGEEGGLYLADICKLAEAVGLPSVMIDDVSQLEAKLRDCISNASGPLICDVRLNKDETLWPKSAAVPQDDGSMMSMPLEDMSPLLSREELRSNLLIELDPASSQVVDES